MNGREKRHSNAIEHAREKREDVVGRWNEIAPLHRLRVTGSERRDDEAEGRNGTRPVSQGNAESAHHP